MLAEPEVSAWLEAHHEWRREGAEIRRDVECPSFPAAIAFVNRVAEAAEAADHHPDIDIRWRTVRLALSTHSAGGLTPMDTAMAERIDGLVFP